MPRGADPVNQRLHRKIGADLFNFTWSLLDRKRRTKDEDAEMLNAAHASLYHWSQAGTPRNRAIGEWQVSRVYSVLGRSEPAIHHARRALQIARRGGLGAFHLAYGYEALARAANAAERPRDRNRYIREARRIGKTIRDTDDRRMLFEDLATIPSNDRR